MNPWERHHPQPPTLENPTDNESENLRELRTDRNIQEQRRYDEKETASIKTETKKFNGMRMETRKPRKPGDPETKEKESLDKNLQRQKSFKFQLKSFGNS